MGRPSSKSAVLLVEGLGWGILDIPSNTDDASDKMACRTRKSHLSDVQRITSAVGLLNGAGLPRHIRCYCWSSRLCSWISLRKPF